MHDTEALRLLTSVMGTDKIVLGSDYPFPLGEVTNSYEGVYPGCHVDEADFLSDEQKGKIYSENALQFLGLRKEDYAPEAAAADAAAPSSKKQKL